MGAVGTIRLALLILVGVVVVLATNSSTTFDDVLATYSSTTFDDVLATNSSTTFDDVLATNSSTTTSERYPREESTETSATSTRGDEGRSANLPCTILEDATSGASSYSADASRSTTEVTSSVVADDARSTPLILAPPTNLSAVEYGATWVLISWNDSENPERVRYTLFARAEETDEVREVVDLTGTRYNVTELCQGRNYVFTIVATMDGYEAIGPSEKTTTAIQEVTNLSLHIVDRNATLRWSPPLSDLTCSYKYEIEVCAEMDCVESETTSDTSYDVQGLRYCTEYVFTVKVIADVESVGKNVTDKTTSPKLGKPRSVKVEARNFGLYIHWKPPLNAECIKEYRITIDSPPATTFTKYTNVTMKNLKACATYKIYINAINKNNGDGETVTINEKTAVSVREPPTLSEPGLWISVDSITIEWTIALEPNNECSITSLITSCSYVGTDGHGYDLSNGQSVDKVGAKLPVKVNVTIFNLSPYTKYRCFGVVVNEGGNSTASNVTDVITLEDVPSAPIFSVEEISRSQFTLAWEAPRYVPGRLNSFEIELRWESLFPVPDWCNDPAISSNATILLNGTVFKHVHVEAMPFANYTARIRAETGAGWGNYSHFSTFLSATGVPGPVTNFTCSLVANKNKPNYPPNKLHLNWALPCYSNGILESFNISLFGVRDGYRPHSFNVLNPIDNAIDKSDQYSMELGDLQGEYNYTVKVAAKGKDVDEIGVPANCGDVHYPAGIPPQPDEAYIKSITIDPHKTRRSASAAAVLLPLFPDTNGDVQYYAIMVSEMGYNVASEEGFDLKTSATAWPNVSSWEDAMLRDFSITYQATIPRWDPYQANYVIDYGHMKAVKYILGEDTTCKEVSLNTDKRLYCNGPLKADTWYHVRMRAFTYGGYADSSTFVVKTNAELNVALVIGIVFGILFLGILTTMMLLVRRCSPQAVFRRFLHSDMPGSPVPAPFTRKKFMAHCQQLVDNPGKLSNEFRLLQTLSVDLQMPTNTACLQANRKKNRYSDILPYDFSRVKLEVIDNDPNTDYINASFIRGCTGEDEYIACQGPKEETTYDFWRMVDQYDVKTIIMLTQLIEKGKEKCHQYFPTIRETFSFENMTIRCTSELDFRTYTQRTLVLQKENKKRSIIHLHFKDWPDHDVPEDFDPMIHFCQIARRNITTNKGYAVVHCSAGIGRTGTLIAIDILLQHLRDNRKLDVFGTVYRLRHHRINMVQRESQYAYIYNCLRQVLKNPYFLKTYKPPPVEAIPECNSKRVKDTSNSNINLVDNAETQRDFPAI